MEKNGIIAKAHTDISQVILVRTSTRIYIMANGIVYDNFVYYGLLLFG